MNQVRVSPLNKNCAVEQVTYSKDGGSFRIDTVWGFATFLFDAQEAEKVRLALHSEDGIVISDFECELDEAFDCDSEDVVLIEWNFPDVEFDEFQLLSAHQDFELEDLGWDAVSTDWVFLGELEFFDAS